MSSTRFHLILAGIVATTSVLAFGYWLQHLKVTEQTLLTALKTINDQPAVSEQTARLSNLLAATEADRATLERYFVANQELARRALRAELTALAASHDVTLSGIMFTTPEAGALDVPLVAVSFGFSGARAEALTYLAKLELLPYASYLAAARYGLVENDDAPPSVKGQVTLHLAVKNSDL